MKSPSSHLKPITGFGGETINRLSRSLQPVQNELLNYIVRQSLSDAGSLVARSTVVIALENGHVTQWYNGGAGSFWTRKDKDENE